MNPARIGGYEILSELGRGAMGIVYHARDTAIGRPIAIKVIRVDAGVSPQHGAELRQRLIREASMAGNISHPGIVTVYQLGEDGDAVFIAMEFVEGASLESLLTNNPSMERAWALDILAQIAVALDYAHKTNIIHRDIKPANILVRSDGRVKIADFGIAKLSSDASAGMTGTGVSIGSPAYMSPEQIQAMKIDGRSDQFALGTIAFQMLAGRLPFRGSTAHTLMYQIVMGDPFEPLPGDKPFSPRVRAVLARALAKNPADRFPTCATFIQELTAAVDGPPAVSQDRTLKFQAEAPPVFVPPAQEIRRGSKAWLLLPTLGGFLTMAMVGAIIYWYTHQYRAVAYVSRGSALLQAVAGGNVMAVKSLLAKGANVNESDREGTSPLMLASERNAPAPMVEALLAAGAQVDAVDAQGRSSLYRASVAGEVDAMRILLDHQANVNLRAKDFSTPLLEAVTHGRLEAARLLIERGADVDLGDSTNTTPLMAAAVTSAEIQNPADFLKLLLKHGAKRGLKDSRGRIAFQRAVESNNPRAVAVLR
jgi:ankyrin repeat protein/predicted Ser/Thr protein kinase